jgi:acyl-CoA thioesterase II
MAANFVVDSSVTPTGSPGQYRAALSPEWAVWGPNGGYLAAIALQAALCESRLSRPASFHCHFLAVGQFADVEIQVTALGGGKRAHALRVDVSQAGRLLLAASAWLVDDGLQGFEHDVGQRPAVPRPEELRGYHELAEDYAQWFPIWRSIEGRPVRFREPPGDPVWHTWLRFTGTPIESRAHDALRMLFWLDFPGWNAAISAHRWPHRFIAPNLDLTVQFHRFTPDVDWLLCEGFVPVASDGLIGCVGRLWTPDGRLVATGTSKHSCRPNPNYEAELARARSLGLAD